MVVVHLSLKILGLQTTGMTVMMMMMMMTMIITIIITQYFIIKLLMRWQNSHKASYGGRTENTKIHPKTNYGRKNIQKFRVIHFWAQ